MTPSNIELRTNPTRIELRKSTKGPGIAAGYAASYNTLSENLGNFREVLFPGCFRNAVKRGDEVVELLNHESSRLLGRRSAGTLRIFEDDYGLGFECDLPDTNDGRDTKTLLERGDLKSCSFSFRCDQDEWSEATDPATGEQFSLRTVKDVTLYDCSIVAQPAYSSGTSASARNLVPASVLAEARSFSTRVKTGILTRAEIEKYNLKARALKIAIDMDS